MFAFVLKRLFWFVPTIVFILLLVFILIRIVQPEPLQNELEAQYQVQIDEKKLLQEWNHQANELELNLPVFYASLVPFDFPISFYDQEFSDQKIIKHLFRQEKYDYQSTLKCIQCLKPSLLTLIEYY